MKVILTISLFLYFENSFACKINMHDACVIENNPLEANLIVIGTVETINSPSDPYNSKEKKFFNVEKQWTNSLSSLKFLSGYINRCETLRAEDKKKYLLLNKYSVNSEADNSTGIKNSKGILISLDKAESYIDKLAIIKTIPNNQSNPSWEYCKEDQHCVETKNVCGDTVGVNKKYRVNYEHFVKDFNGEKKCDTLKGLTSNAKLKCISYFCGYEK